MVVDNDDKPFYYTTQKQLDTMLAYQAKQDHPKSVYDVTTRFKYVLILTAFILLIINVGFILSQYYGFNRERFIKFMRGETE